MKNISCYPTKLLANAKLLALANKTEKNIRLKYY